MGYKLIITEQAEELLDKLIYYLLHNIKNEQAAIHLLDSVDKIYDRMEDNPFQFPECRDLYLSHLGYREAVLVDMKYLVIGGLGLIQTIYLASIPCKNRIGI
jgi:hypothetical protein